MKPTLMHCSYHKCLTIYYNNVIGKMLNKVLRKKHGYKHFNSLVDDFYDQQELYVVASVNNHCLDLNKYADYRLTRFVRDPRDMIVSGYFYHKRGAEPWCNVTSPVDDDWKVVNGNIPEGMRGTEHSYASYLTSLEQEDGLLAELEFRKNHYQSMKQWPQDDPNIRLFRYEDIIGNEVAVMEQILEFYELPWHQKKIGRYLANKNSASNRRVAQATHVRDPSAGQWKKHFTPKVEAAFNDLYSDLLSRYGYDQS